MNSNIRIETVENGFIVITDDGGIGMGFRPGPDGRFAFESFDSLTKWLEGNLKKPEALLKSGKSP